jgi:hypothetical protein
MLRKEMFDKAIDLVNQINEEIELWDKDSFNAHLIELLGIEFIKKTESLPISFPLEIKCAPETAIKIGLSQHFEVELCGKDHFRIWPKCIECIPDDDRAMLSLHVRSGTEYQSIVANPGQN